MLCILPTHSAKQITVRSFSRPEDIYNITFSIKNGSTVVVHGCSCPDFVARRTPCKHIFLVERIRRYRYAKISTPLRNVQGEPLPLRRATPALAARQSGPNPTAQLNAWMASTAREARQLLAAIERVGRIPPDQLSISPAVLASMTSDIASVQTARFHAEEIRR